MKDKDTKKQILDEVIRELVEEAVKKSFVKAEPELVKFLNKKELESFTHIFIKFFYYLSGISVFLFWIIHYYIPNALITPKSTALVVETIDIVSLIMNYIFLALVFIIVFFLITSIDNLFSSRSYTDQIEYLFRLRNLLFILFIILFCIQSFTIEQLDLVSTIISTVVLFEIVLKDKNSISENSLKSEVAKEYTRLMLSELDNKKHTDS